MLVVSAQFRSLWRCSLARLVAALLLFAAAGQALAPGYSPAEPTRGSAFSATTGDVALAPARQAETVRGAPLPVPPLTGSLRPLALRPQVALYPQLAPRPDSTGPPSAQPRASLPDPRAPPIA